jgi:hypothetical protein
VPVLLGNETEATRQSIGLSPGRPATNFTLTSNNRGGLLDVRRPKPYPNGLNDDGKALWCSVTREFDFNSAELALLQQLCQTVDEIVAMKREMSDMGVVVAGSKGQPVVNPILRVLSEHRKLADQLTAALALPVDGEVVGHRRTAAAKQAAQPGPRKTKSRGRIAAVQDMSRPARTERN